MRASTACASSGDEVALSLRRTRPRPAVPREAIEAFVAANGPGSDSPLVVAELRQLGGALGRPASNGGALDHLGGLFAAHFVGIPMDADQAVAIEAQLTRSLQAIEPWSHGLAYSNFAERRVRPTAIWPEATHERLVRVKRDVDPTGMFVSNHPV